MPRNFAPQRKARGTAAIIPGDPFTLQHFRAWCRQLLLRNGERWLIEPFQLAFAQDTFDDDLFEAWLIIPEGNAKTTLAAGLALYHCQFTPWASVAVAAASRDQAKTDWDAAAGFVQRANLGGFTVHPGLRRIRYRPHGSEIQIWAADSRTGDGIDPTMTIIDELHRHRDLELYRTWRGKLQKSGGRMVAISTAGEPGSEFELTREAIRQADPDGRRTPTFARSVTADGLVMHEFAVPEDGDVEDLDLVKQANPLRAITTDTLKRVRGGQLQTLGHWRRFNCNLPTRSESAAITEAEWFAAAVDDAIPEGTPIYAGLDVAWKWDTTALVPLWIRDAEYRLLGPASILVPPRDGRSLDPNEVEGALIDLHRRTPIHTLVMDVDRAAQLAEWAGRELGCEVVERPQGNPQQAEAYERFMEALRQGWLHHTNDPGLNQHALNAIARMLPGGGARFDRPQANRISREQDVRVIDALVAAAMAHADAAEALAIGDRVPLVAFI